jgi:FkbM family methyltransferase
MDRKEFQRRLLTKLRRHAHRIAVRFGKQRPREFIVLNGHELRIWHRGTLADTEAINQCLRQQQYDIPIILGTEDKAVDTFYSQLVARGQKPLIVDAGSHIGSSALWFSARFPDSHIIAIEPAPENFSLLEINASPYNIECIQAGLGGSSGSAYLTDSSHSSWGFRIIGEGTGPAVKILTIKDVLDQYNRGALPFMLKLDIEGSEENLFDAYHEIFARFPVIAIEIHDWMLPKKSVSESFLKFHLREKRKLLNRGENLFSIDFKKLCLKHD